MKAVLASLKPYYYYLVGEGIKSIEVRKTFPKSEDWNKDTYFYMSRDEKSFARIPKEFQEKYRRHFGKVGLRFVCDNIITTSWFITPDHPMWQDGFNEEMCLTDRELFEYSKGDTFYEWHISDLVIYDKPRELGEFYQVGKSTDFAYYDYCSGCPYHETPVSEYPCNECDGNRKYLYRPPRSWCYVERSENGN